MLYIKGKKSQPLSDEFKSILKQNSKSVEEILSSPREDTVDIALNEVHVNALKNPPQLWGAREIK